MDGSYKPPSSDGSADENDIFRALRRRTTHSLVSDLGSSNKLVLRGPAPPSHGKGQMRKCFLGRDSENPFLSLDLPKKVGQPAPNGADSSQPTIATGVLPGGQGSCSKGKEKEVLSQAAIDQLIEERRTGNSAASIGRQALPNLDDESDIEIISVQSMPLNGPSTQGTTSRRVEESEFQKILDATTQASPKTQSLAARKAQEKVAALKKAQKEKESKQRLASIPSDRLAENSSLANGPLQLFAAAKKRRGSTSLFQTDIKRRSAPVIPSASHKQIPTTGVAPSNELALPPKPVQTGSGESVRKSKPAPLELPPGINSADLFKHFESQLPNKRTTVPVHSLPEPITPTQNRLFREEQTWKNRNAAVQPGPATADNQWQGVFSSSTTQSSQIVNGHGNDATASSTVAQRHPDLNRSLAAPTKGPREIPADQNIALPPPAPPLSPPPPPPPPPARARARARPRARASKDSGQRARMPTLSPVGTDSEVEVLPDDSPKESKGIVVEKVLDESGLIFQYVSYRTGRFDPQKFTRDDKKIRGLAYFNRAKANEDSRMRFDVPELNVIGKEFNIKDGYLSAVIRYSTGLEQHFWVEQELRDVHTLNQIRRKFKKKAIKIDPNMAKVYRERFDVISYKAQTKYTVDGPQRETVEWDIEDADNDSESRSSSQPPENIVYSVPQDYENPLDLVDWEINNHGTFVDLETANGFAVAMFRHLSKPENPRAADNEEYADLMESLNNARETWDFKTEPVEFRFNPSQGYDWAYKQLRIHVHRAELHGPKEIGDMVIGDMMTDTRGQDEGDQDEGDQDEGDQDEGGQDEGGQDEAQEGEEEEPEQVQGYEDQQDLSPVHQEQEQDDDGDTVMSEAS